MAEDLHHRRLREYRYSTGTPTLSCLDGSKAMALAVKSGLGENANLQRGQVHKVRKIEGHVVKKYELEIRRRLNETYARNYYADAKRRFLQNSVVWLRTTNPYAAASLQNGFEETLTLTKLGLERKLKRFFSTTNAIESMLGRVDDVMRPAKQY